MESKGKIKVWFEYPWGVGQVSYDAFEMVVIDEDTKKELKRVTVTEQDDYNSLINEFKGYRSGAEPKDVHSSHYFYKRLKYGTFDHILSYRLTGFVSDNQN